ncbi:uncharacterized protein TrAtP1_008324 [Trichoderma atroviride]|uniref:uncharacterized protein n=1 Tax=Hypocrea atroviridis TaxID=63577 RepID=UPI0033320919|nr:hypothetical protein TrAtP1_008324 [Trichoderma atroviride]
MVIESTRLAKKAQLGAIVGAATAGPCCCNGTHICSNNTGDRRHLIRRPAPPQLHPLRPLRNGDFCQLSTSNYSLTQARCGTGWRFSSSHNHTAE